jgi:hypothetical protein
VIIPSEEKNAEIFESTPKRKCQRQDYTEIGHFNTEEECQQWLAEEDTWTRLIFILLLSLAFSCKIILFRKNVIKGTFICTEIYACKYARRYANIEPII